MEANGVGRALHRPGNHCWVRVGHACIDPADDFLRVAPRSLKVFRIYVDDFLTSYATTPADRSAEGRRQVRDDAIEGTITLVDNLEAKGKLPVAKEAG